MGDPVQLSDIQAVDWSGRLNGFGRVVENIDDIHQCIGILLRTPKGGRPHEPLFGCDAWKYLDRPAGQAVAHIIRETAAAVTLWEPRVTLLSVTADYENAAAGHVTLTLVWILKHDATAQNQTTEVNL